MLRVAEILEHPEYEMVSQVPTLELIIFLSQGKMY